MRNQGMFKADELTLFVNLCDVLIPKVGSFLSATEAGVPEEWAATIMGVRPDLRADFYRALRTAKGRSPEEVIRELQETDPDAFVALATVIAGGYFLSPAVKKLIGYPGQESRPYDPDEVPQYLKSGLLDAVLQRGKVYRDAR